MFEFLFLDLDNTIFDFDKAEHIAVSKALSEAGVTVTEQVIAQYSHINKLHWQRLERGELNRDQVKLYRFKALFEELGIPADAAACAANYEKLLGIGHYFLPGAKEALDRLSKKYRLFLASNGTASVQAGRLTSANLYRYFEKVFISEEVGADKPSKTYFDRCFAQILDLDPARAMIVGDSLTSDILGGNNAGIATCWVNPNGVPRKEGIHVDYEIQALSQLGELLENIPQSGGSD